jgi:hypothetical protein
MPLWFKRDRDEIAAMGKPPKTHESGLVVHTADPSKAPKDLVDLMTNLDAVVKARLAAKQAQQKSSILKRIK